MMLDPSRLNLWTIYDNPSDYPGQFVARLWTNGRPTATVICRPTLDAAREAVQAATPYVLDMIVRAPSDDACIVESWL